MHFQTIHLALLPTLALGLLACGSTPTPTEPSPPIASAAEHQGTKAPIAIPAGEQASQAATPGYSFAFGNYEQIHVAFNECDDPDMCEVQVTDLLTIGEAADGAVDVAIELNQDNGHSCSYSGILAKLGEAQWGWSDETQTCQIELTLGATSLNVTSDGCRETYCGARAQLDGSFALTGHIKP
tara:strand:+ start:8101 stop:8649 length:549 start_codon:yes stop_codon:yes gene_type:complete